MQAGDLQGAFSSLLSLSLNWLPLVVNFLKGRNWMNCFDVFLPLHYECLCASDVWDAKASFYETDSWRAGHRNIPRHCFHPPRHTHHQSTQHLCGAASVCFACGGWLRWDHKLQYWHRVPFYQRNLINFILIRFFFVPFLTGKVVDIYSKFDVIVSLNIPHFLLYQILGAYCCLVVCWLCCCV